MLFRSGLFHQAASDMDIDLHSSFMVGDKITDVLAGAAAGCRTIMLVNNSSPAVLETATPDHTSLDLRKAVDWILRQVEGYYKCCIE